MARGAFPAATQPLPSGGANRQPPTSSGGIATNGANPQSGEQPLGGLGPIDVDEEDMQSNHYNQNEQTQWKWKDAFQPRRQEPHTDEGQYLCAMKAEPPPLMELKHMQSNITLYTGVLETPPPTHHPNDKRQFDR